MPEMNQESVKPLIFFLFLTYFYKKFIADIFSESEIYIQFRGYEADGFL